jgi:hypothetical protein
MRSPVFLSVCVYVCVPPNNVWTNLWIFMKFSRKIKPLKVTSTPYFLIPYLQPFQNGGRSNFWDGCKTCIIQRGNMKFCFLIDLQRMNNFKWDHFCQNKKYEHGGQFNVKIHSLFCGNNSWTVALRQINIGVVKDHGHIYKFYLNHCFVWRSF